MCKESKAVDPAAVELNEIVCGNGSGLNCHFVEDDIVFGLVVAGDDNGVDNHRICDRVAQ